VLPVDRLRSSRRHPTAHSISADQLAAKPDEQRAALLQVQDTAALTPVVVALVKAEDDPSRIVSGDVMFIMQERLGDPIPRPQDRPSVRQPASADVSSNRIWITPQRYNHSLLLTPGLAMVSHPLSFRDFHVFSP
jgi:hypothetical protein